MPDLDLGILEILIAFFLFLPLVRPFVKGLWQASGLVWFPPIAFFCILGIFLVYGFRPECVPLLAYCIIVNIAGLHEIGAFVSHLRNTDFIDRSFAAFFIHIFFLSIVITVALVFLPLNTWRLLTENVEFAVYKNETFNMRIYGNQPEKSKTETDSGNDAPVVLIVPPMAGSNILLDLVCAELSNQGNIVVSYSHKGMDIPAYMYNKKIYLPPVHILFNVWETYRKAIVYQKENETARMLEAERKNDIISVMSYIEKRWPKRKKVIIGYGMGGSAAVYLSADDAFVSKHPKLCGVLAIESRLYSSFYGERQPEKYMEPILPFEFAQRIENWLVKKKPVKINALHDAPQLKVPVQFVFSASNETLDMYLNPYAIVQKTAAENDKTAVMRNYKDIHPVDWTDIPVKYPFIRFLAAGTQISAWKNSESISNTAKMFHQFIASSHLNAALSE
jgi:dienelactone hydrolase